MNIIAVHKRDYFFQKAYSELASERNGYLYSNFKKEHPELYPKTNDYSLEEDINFDIHKFDSDHQSGMTTHGPILSHAEYVDYKNRILGERFASLATIIIEDTTQRKDIEWAKSVILSNHEK